MITQMFKSSMCLAVLIAVFGANLPTVVSAQILSVPFPEPSTNAALHYNRAILTMSVIPIEERKVLSQPIWEAFGDSSKKEIDEIVTRLVYDCRHVLRAALHGTDQIHAEFGIDYSHYGNGAVLPHAQPMLHLGRLVTLAGIRAQIHGEWEKAGTLFFQGMRLGRHMTDQPTLVESLVGAEILENNYYAIALWASKCPELKLVKQAFLRFELSSPTMIQPVKTMAYEASIKKHQLNKLVSSYPDGAWCEMLLEALGENTVVGSRNEHIEKCKEFCNHHGIPGDVFASKESFDDFANRISKLNVMYLQASAACMDLPPLERIDRAKKLMAKFEPEFREVGDEEMLDVGRIASFFATHDAEQTMARIALAVSSSRTDKGFPESLDQVAGLFLGSVPKNPYDDSDVEYAVLNDGQDFSVVIPEVDADGVTLPRIEFSSLRE